MKSTKDIVTTVLGGVLAAGTAAQPIMIAAGEQSLHQADYMQLVMAVVMAVFGYFTNKGSRSGE